MNDCTDADTNAEEISAGINLLRSIYNAENELKEQSAESMLAENRNYIFKVDFDEIDYINVVYDELETDQFLYFATYNSSINVDVTDVINDELIYYTKRVIKNEHFQRLRSYVIEQTTLLNQDLIMNSSRDFKMTTFYAIMIRIWNENDDSFDNWAKFNVDSSSIYSEIIEKYFECLEKGYTNEQYGIMEFTPNGANLLEYKTGERLYG